jgi:hypothetical protein
MKKDTRPNPEHHKIWKYWLLHDEAYERLKDIDERLGTKIIDKLTCIDHDFPECWCCRKQRGDWSKFERCHIIPRALGGQSDPSNFFLMCKRCHRESPTSANEDAFWLYVNSVKNRAELIVDIIKDTERETGFCFMSCASIFMDMINSDDIVPVSGQVPMEGLKHILMARALSQRTEQHNIKDVQKIVKEFSKKANELLCDTKHEMLQDLRQTSAINAESFLSLLRS